MPVLFVNDFIINGNGIFSGTVAHCADVMQEFTLLVKQLECSTALADTDILVGGKNEPGFE